jgi:hypothetical protein
MFTKLPKESQAFFALFFDPVFSKRLAGFRNPSPSHRSGGMFTKLPEESQAFFALFFRSLIFKAA